MEGMEEFKDIFFTECTELLTDMEARLLALGEGVTDTDALNAIFRCAHSIKGGSGAFGMSAIMNFTHVLEALLDLMRDGKFVPDRESIDVLLKSNDVVTQMLDMERRGEPVPQGFGAETAEILLALCEGRPIAASQAVDVIAEHSPVAQATESPAEAEQAPVAEGAEAPAQDEVKAVCFDITFYPHPELFASGNEPVLILRELAGLGWLDVEVDVSRIPELDELDETRCYLGWKLVLFTESPREAVEEVFEFVQHISDITINTPASVLKNAVAAICEPAEQAQAEQANTPVAEGAETPAQEDAKTPPAAAVAKEVKDEGKPTVTTSIRVDLDKVDRLVNMVGELVITEAMLRSQVRQMGTDAPLGLQRGLDEMSQHTRELQEAVMAVRMQPVKSIFSRMPRIVRDTSAQLEKDIQLILSGENTEVDKTVIEQLGDPLNHNGWADVFAATPVDGLRDVYLQVDYPLPVANGVQMVAQLHDFTSDNRDEYYGYEWGMSLEKRLSPNWLIGAKYADYTAKGYGADTAKGWLYAQYTY